MSEPQVSIVVPTYNESANIGPLIGALRSALDGIRHEIVVVDDDSKDGTGALAKTAGADQVIVRKDERGLATAVVEGFRRAKAPLALVMDADFQHPVATVRAMVERALDAEADLVVGSRYVDGGDDGSFSTGRRFMSKGAAALGKLALPPVRRHKITDPMSGLFLVRLECIALDELRPQGYKILLEVLAKGRLERVEEVGFAFGTRAGGQSKLGAAVMWHYLMHLLALAWNHPENRRPASFAAVGASGVLVNLGLLWLFTEEVGFHYALSAALAIEASILTNFLLNDWFTFRDRRTGHKLARAAKFNAVSLGAMAVNLTVLLFLTEILGIHYLASEAVAIVAAFAANYAGNMQWTYGGADRFRMRRFVQELPRNAMVLAAPIILGGAAFALYAHDLDRIDEVYFDEHYYVSVARQIDNGIWEDPCWDHAELGDRPLNYEHPPLAKLIMGWSVDKFDTSHAVFPGCRTPDSDEYNAFTEDLRLNGNPWAWRLPSAVMGALTVGAAAWAARRLFASDAAGWIAGFLVLTDTLILSSARIALLDIFATGFAVAALAAATHPSKRAIAVTAILLGFGFASKYPVLFLGLPVLAISLWTQHQAGRLTRRRFDWTVVTLIFVPLLIWTLSYWPWWRIWVPEMGVGGASMHLYELTRDAFAWTTTGVQTHADASQPGEWFALSTPVMYYAVNGDVTARAYAVGNPALWWGSALLILGGWVWAVRRWLDDRKLAVADQRVLLGLLPATFAYGSFFLLTRTAFIFYMTLVVPFLAIGAAGMIARYASGLRGRAIALAWIALCVVAFAWYEPIVTARPLSMERLDEIFGLVPWMDP